MTKREWEILWMITKGHDNKGIAELLGIRTQTVKNHISNVLSKMQAKNRTHAAMIAMRKGWLDFPISDAPPDSDDTDMEPGAVAGQKAGAPGNRPDDPRVEGPGKDALSEYESRFRITG